MGKKNYELIEEEISVKNARNNNDLALSFIPDQIDFLEKELDFLI